MYDNLKIILWPDPRLRKISTPVEVFDESLAVLSARMLELMREAKGVGLAAPQVGLNIRLFVANPTGEPEDDRVFVNPVLSDAEGEAEAEEGCLSLPGIEGLILRARSLAVTAKDVNGQPFDLRSDEFPARVWQHEFDHLNGTLLMDRMGPAGKIAAKKKLRELEEKYEESQPKKKR